MYDSVISILAGWIIFSTLLVTMILVNSSRMSRTNDVEFNPGQKTGEFREKNFELTTLLKKLIK